MHVSCWATPGLFQEHRQRKWRQATCRYPHPMLTQEPSRRDSPGASTSIPDFGNCTLLASQTVPFLLFLPTSQPLHTPWYQGCDNIVQPEPGTEQNLCNSQKKEIWTEESRFIKGVQYTTPTQSKSALLQCLDNSTSTAMHIKLAKIDTKSKFYQCRFLILMVLDATCQFGTSFS